MKRARERIDRAGCRGPAPGFTLVEILVTLMILGTVVSILSTVLISSDRTHRRTARRAEVQAATRQALSLVTTELRQAGADPRIPPLGLVGVVSADSSAVRVRADLNADGAIQTTEPSEDVTFTYDPGTQRLLRDPGSGASAALDHVTDMRFSYFDASNQPLASLPLSASDRALVRSIGVTVTCEDEDSEPFTLSTRVTLRNR
jgi:type IV pilus assembly protein PilW